MSMEKCQQTNLRCPQTLSSICMNYIVDHLETLCFKTNYGYTFCGQQILHFSICDSLIESIQNNGYEFSDRLAHLFKDITRTNVRSVQIRNSKLITDEGLKYLIQHRLFKLTITDCPNITYKTYVNIFEHSCNLRYIYIHKPDNKSIADNENSDNSIWSWISKKIITKEIPKLKKLRLHAISEENNDTDHVNRIFEKLEHLRLLDLSFCWSVDNLKFLCQLSKIKILILYNVKCLQKNMEAIVNICSLKSLVTLDISQSHYASYKDADPILSYIIVQLPNLKYLDISGTNLAGTRRTIQSLYEPILSEIPGLEFRVHNPLEFLGLFGTKKNACRRLDIPAKRISGNNNEEQLFNAISSFMEKPVLLLRALHEYIIFFTYHNNNQLIQIDQTPDIILKVLKSYMTDKQIQSRAIEILRIIVKNKDLTLFNDITMKREIITIILTVLVQENYNRPSRDSACLVLYSFPEDLMFKFKLAVPILLKSFIKLPPFTIPHKSLKSIMSQANHEQIIELGDTDAIKIMVTKLEMVIGRLEILDNILIVTWSIIRILTCEAPKNCEIFLDEIILQNISICWRYFLDRTNPILETLPDVLASLSNIAEVKKLRPRLMDAEIIFKVCDVLFFIQDRIEISYNAVRFFAYLMSDGYEAWTIKEPSRDEVLQCMTNAIQRWNLDANRDIYHRSFEPILQLAQVEHTAQCIHFAVWVLANLTKKYPEKYCSTLIADGGLSIMKELLKNHKILESYSQPRVIHSLAQTVIHQCLMYNKTQKKNHCNES